MSNKLKILLAIQIITIFRPAWTHNSHGQTHGHLHSNSNHDTHDPTAEQLQNMTSKALTVDEWLFSQDLFPGHVIPQSIQHSEAIKMFNVLLEDNDLFSKAYDKYRKQHNKDVEDVKIEWRKMHFRDNLNFIFHHNLKADVGQYRFQLGVNMFADMSKDEMSHFLGAKDRLPIIHPKKGGKDNVNPMQPPLPPHHAPPQLVPQNISTIHPLNWDLRDVFPISPIRNQRKCGSCVFFSHAALIECLYAEKTGELINVSEQMMLDCAHKEFGYENNEGCDGNMMEDTGRFLVEHGVTTEEHYSYQAERQNCSKEGKDIIAKLSDYWQVEPNVAAFKDTLVILKKPIAAAYWVWPTFMFYRTGIFDWCMPPNGPTGGHAVLIVGYGKQFDQEYWIVRNSWGKSWGEIGYFKYAMGSTFCGFERWGFTGSLE